MPPTNSELQPRPYPSLLSLVLPMYNEEAIVPLLRGGLGQFMAEVKCDTEVILVNDGSSDGTLSRIAEWAAVDPRVKVLSLSRNFGHQIACTAGLDYATGDAVVIMDCDLQDPLAVIHEMIDRYCQGYDVAYGQRAVRRGETWFKLFCAWLFYRLMHTLVYKDLPVDTGDFRLLSRRCLDALQQMRETHRFLRGMVTWMGFHQIAVKYERAPRAAGVTKYPVWKLMKLAWTAATSFSILPLRISMIMGAIVTLLGVEEAIRAVVAYIFHWHIVPGWSSLTVLISVIGGATLVCLGIIGEYVGKLYEQAKNRPLYFIAEAFNVTSCELHIAPERATQALRVK